jgi:hypothetical protein
VDFAGWWCVCGRAAAELELDATHSRSIHFAQDFGSGLPLLHPATRKPRVPGTPASLTPAKRLKLSKSLWFEADDAFVSGDGRTSRWFTVEESSHRLWCRYVMAVHEKCDEKKRASASRISLFHFRSSESVIVVTEGVMLPEHTAAVIFSCSNSGCSRFTFPRITQLTVAKLGSSGRLAGMNPMFLFAAQV